jgi:hypothetical protein
MAGAGTGDDGVARWGCCMTIENIVPGAARPYPIRKPLCMYKDWQALKKNPQLALEYVDVSVPIHELHGDWLDGCDRCDIAGALARLFANDPDLVFCKDDEVIEPKWLLKGNHDYWGFSVQCLVNAWRLAQYRCVEWAEVIACSA